MRLNTPCYTNYFSCSKEKASEIAGTVYSGGCTIYVPGVLVHLDTQDRMGLLMSFKHKGLGHDKKESRGCGELPEHLLKNAWWVLWENLLFPTKKEALSLLAILPKNIFSPASHLVYIVETEKGGKVTTQRISTSNRK